MAREFAKVKSGIWQDDDFRELPREAQHLYFVILTDPELSYCGVTDWRPRRIVPKATNWTLADVQDAGTILSERLLIVVDEDTEEVLVRSFLRHDGVMQHNKLCISAMTAFSAVASNDLRGVIVHELNRLAKEFPEWPSWERDQVREVLKRRTLDPELVPRLAPGVAPGLGPGPAPEPAANASRPQPVPYNSNGNSTITTATSEPEGFADFWNTYPRREGKGKAREAYEKALAKIDHHTIISSARKYAQANANTERKFVAMPTTWLNQERWDDDHGTPKRQDPTKPLLPGDPGWDDLTDDQKIANIERANRMEAAR